MNCYAYYPMTEKEIAIQAVVDEMDYRFEGTDYEVLNGDEFQVGNQIITYSIVKIDNGKIRIGISIYNFKKYPYDRIGETLSICRACKWKDLEKELLSML